MPTLDAELQVAGHTYPVLETTFAFDQPVDNRGRPLTRVHPGPIRLVLDVPADDFLLHWAAAPHLEQAGHLTFFASGLARIAYETVFFAAGQCVSYREEFRHGDRHHGAYHCYLTLVAPRYELLAGGPGAALAATIAPPRPAALQAVVKPPTPVVQGWGDKLGDLVRRNPTQPITDPGKLASLKRVLHAQQKLLTYRQDCLRRWNVADQSCFTKVFGTATEPARQLIQGRIGGQLKHVAKLLTDDAYALRVFDATPPKLDEYAHVWPGDERHFIYLNKHFWSSSLTGTDSKAGTLSHEMSHFDDLGATDDVEYQGQTMYGVSRALRLAQAAPDKALQNADNYEYYLEGAICP